MSLSPAARNGVSGWPAILLKLEGAALLAAASFAYSRFGGEWRWFAYLFFAPDLSFLAYLAGPRLGAVAYNSVHTTFIPLIFGALGVWLKEPFMTQIAAIHLAHIGFDHALGYGLKYGTAFADTHLGRIGRKVEPV
jgi:hypothetical protein